MSIRKTTKSYLAEIMMRKKRSLLVEGKTDKQLLEKLIDRFSCFYTGNSYDVQIDSAEILDVPGEIGERGKVKATCSFIFNSGKLSNKRFAGFVDREFDSFDLDKLQDLLEKHHVEGCLVWSRGHSIENYLFEFSLFKELFWELLNTAWASQALAKFEMIFDEIIRLACSVGLAAKQHKKINFVRSSINPGILKISNERISIDFLRWREKLAEKGLAASEIEELIKSCDSYYDQLLDVDLITIKRLCHGHLGFELIIFAFCCCVEEIHRCTPDSEEHLQTLISKIRGVKKTKFDQCATWWSRKVEEQKCEYPKELFLLLGILNEGVEHVTE